jgi:hypothetical protein
MIPLPCPACALELGDIRDVAERLGARLKRVTKHEHAGPCPACGGTDRFSINTAKQLWLCRQCAKGGDAIELVRHVNQCCFVEARQFVSGDRLLQPKPAQRVPVDKDDADRIARALALWTASVSPWGTPAEMYLKSRGLELDDDIAGAALRWHPRISAMLALFRNIETDEPQAISRTLLDSEGRKLDRKFLGPTGGAAIKLDADEDVLGGLHIGEGTETSLAARQLGLRPCWAVGSAGAVATIPVLGGVECLTLLAENDDASARAVEMCAAHWHGGQGSAHQSPDRRQGPQRRDSGGSMTVPFTTEAYHPRRDLLLASWVKRKLPSREYLLGRLLCTTSRWILWGETGIGKTLFTLDVAGAISSGSPLLNWEGAGTNRRVMYLDGEMPAETFKERMEIVAERFGPAIPLYGYNREVLKDGEMPPLNTPEGEAWLWKEIDAIKPDLIVFDSIMCLLAGNMSEEESWAPIKDLMRKITSRRIAQIWLHHTGHDISKGFGTKTREWEVDTVVGLTRAGEGGDTISMEFKKARLRTPETRDQFESLLIRRGVDGWIADGAGVAAPRGGRSEELVKVKRAILAAYARLSDAIETSGGFDGAPVRKVPIDKLREEVKSRGFLETKETGGLTDTARKIFQRAKTDLIDAKTHIEAEGQFWGLAASQPVTVTPL